MSIRLGPERTIHFHTTSSPDLGLTLTHTPTTLAMGVSTGYVRITSINSDGGMVTGDVRPNDVVVEAAGVNMRRPISEGMWKLTLGLMEVAPLPLEIVVAQELDEAEAAAAAAEKKGQLTNQDTGADTNEGYYQLETPNKYNMAKDPVLSAKLYRLDDSCDISPQNDCAVSPLPEIKSENEETRNPFLDEGRFGQERTVVFRTESLGVKLHRSSTEGIVHILHVTDYVPPDNSTALAPRDGDIREGDAIMEVGGVDLRNQFIGRLEWADMVHFIRYVERPLEMVVAKDEMFNREKMGLTHVQEEKDVYDVVRESVDLEMKEEPVEGADESMQQDDKAENNDSVIAGIEVTATEELKDLGEDCNAITNVCGAMDIDNACNAMTDGLHTSLPVNDEDVVNELSITPVEHPAESKLNSPIVKVSPGNVKKDNSWIKNPETKTTSSPPRSPLAVFPRTHPSAERDSAASSDVEILADNKKTAEPDASITAKEIKADSISPVRSVSSAAELKSNMESESLPYVIDAPIRKSVAELKGLFSPIKVPEVLKSPEPIKELHEAENEAVEPSSEALVEGNDVKHEDNTEIETIDVTSDAQAADDCVAVIPNNHIGESVAELEKTIDFDAELSVADQVNVRSPKENNESEQTEQQPAEPQSYADEQFLSEEHAQVEVESSEPPSVEEGPYVQELGPTPEKPFDETANSSLHEELVNDLASEFASHSQKSVQPSDSRDDIEHGKHRDVETTKKELKKEDTSNVPVCPKPRKKPPMPPQPVSTPTPSNNTFNSMFVMDDTDSPFCGNIKFSNTPRQRVPVSALFSQAFVVQKNGEETNGSPVTDNIRWESTSSPLFVMKKGSPNVQKTPLGWSPYPEGERTLPERLDPDPLVAFDMTELDVTLNVSDNGSLSDDPSYNPNDTIVYADETEAQANCCGFDNFCADNVMFEGLVSNTVSKEKANKVPSPRRKNLLSRLRKGNQKSKSKVSYGTLDDGMKGIKKAHVQLRKQNLYGISVEAASQYAVMSDMIEI